jgi:Domain of unknown function (DUF6456)
VRSVKTARLSPAELNREALRVLPHMAKRKRLLAPIGDGAHGIFSSATARRPLVSVQTPIVAALERAELIEAVPDAGRRGACFTLSRVGAAFLARTRADEQVFAAQHRVLVPARGLGGAAMTEREPDFNAAESPLGWLRTRKGPHGERYLSDVEFRAGERLRADFTLALMTPKSTASWPLERVDYARRTDFSPAFDSDRANAARKRFWSAIDAAGPELAAILIGVCCHLHGLEALEAALELPRRSCKTILKLGLVCLARHYGLIGRDAQRARIRAQSFGELPEELRRGTGRGVESE